MSPVDVLIPLAAAVVLLARPEAMLRKDTPPAEVPAKAAKLRKVGLVLLAVAAIYALLALARSRG